MEIVLGLWSKDNSSTLLLYLLFHFDYIHIVIDACCNWFDFSSFILCMNSILKLYYAYC
jgi:hypothetical protein